MPNLLYPYLVGLITTVIVPLVAIIMYVLSYRRFLELDRQQKRLPLATRYEDLELRVQDLEVQRDELEAKVYEARELMKEAERERAWMEQHRAEILQMREEQKQLNAHRTEYEAVVTKLADAREKLDQALKERSQADFECSILRQTLVAEKGKFEELKERVANASEQLKKLTADLDTTRKELDEARRKLEKSEEAAAVAERAATLMRMELATLTRERNELEEHVKQLREQVKTSEAKASQLQATCSGLDAQIESNQGFLDKLRAEQRSRDKTLFTAEESLVELWQPAIALGEYKGVLKSQDERKALDGVRNYLKSHGLRFPKRVIDAFHTSLKVANETPLLVLAGISGTGKSLLPRRYAEAMGMHFMNVPVQPRWDGPQDLVGFFNYLENRYKSTELLRALIQMDEHCVDWAPDSYDAFADDRLLLVLLDEMNLARVEYYFSELLSRLETRRDIDPAREEDRVKASLRLDIGDTGTGKPPLVFVNRNVMFVGTMNEDESTMTLSDKVVDRSGIMRFGRPHNLTGNDAASTNGSPETHRAKSYLSMATWTKWIEEGQRRSLPEEIDQQISLLNEALTLIGRPFGYRTRDAIRAYVLQYPDRSEPGLRNAMADQIEQRILPKLRGLDVTEDNSQRAIQGILDLVRTLEDKQLGDAIERANAEMGGHLFVWTGVERKAEE